MLENLLGIRLALKLGKPDSRPKLVSYDVIMALTNVEVTDNAVERDVFQMTFSLGKRQPRDYSLLRTGLFEPRTRVAILLQIGAKVEPLMSGVITHFQLNPSNDAGMSTFTVTGDGIDMMLDLEEKNASYERHSDTMIVQQLIDKYAQYGLTLDVADKARNLNQPDSNRLIPRQYTTDQEHIYQMAERNGFVFYADPLPTGDVKVYWGPENRKGSTQPALTMNMGTVTNVTSLNFTHDSRLPVTAQGNRLQDESKQKSEDSVTPPTDFDVDNLAATQTYVDRVVLMRDIAKYASDRARQRSTELMKARFGAVSANGEVDTVRYGHILRAGQLVGVRGAGALYNGDYYVNKVTHKIERTKSTQQYTQSFELKRESLGARKDKVNS
jgi:hypothetical protein